MKVWGMNETQLQICAEEVGVKLYELREDGRALRFTLRPTGVKREGNYRYQRVSSSGYSPERKVHAVCWHGHRDFMRAIFAREPEARIKTIWFDYKGSQCFEDNFEATGYTNVGSQMYPMQAREVCNCWMDLFAPAPRHHDNVMTSYVMRQSDIGRCKFVIFSPEHYRPDGTCKCDDAEHRAMMIREWEYSEQQFADIPLREVA